MACCRDGRASHYQNKSRYPGKTEMVNRLDWFNDYLKIPQHELDTMRELSRMANNRDMLALNTANALSDVYATFDLSQTKSMFRDVEENLRQMKDAFAKTVFPDLSESLKSIRETARIASIEMHRTLSNDMLYDTMNDAARAFGNLRTDVISEIAKYTAHFDLKPVAGLAEIATLVASQIREANLFSELTRDSFASTITESFRSVMGESPTSTAIADIEEIINDHVAKLPDTGITRKGMIELIFLILGVVLAGWQAANGHIQLRDGRQSSEVQAVQYSQLMSVLEHLVAKTEERAPINGQEKYYVVERRVELRTKPNNQGVSIAILFPNQKTRLVTMNHQWIYVEYFDYLEAVPKYGWANKKYLKMADMN